MNGADWHVLSCIGGKKRKIWSKGECRVWSETEGEWVPEDVLVVGE